MKAQIGSLNSTVSLALVAIGAVILLFLLVMVIIQNRRISQLKEELKPKYGFLGKPLYSFMAVLALSALVTGLFFNGTTTNLPDGTINVGDERKVSAQIKSRVINRTQSGYIVEIFAIPSVNGINWGQGAEFDLFWEISGQKSLSEVELKRSVTKPSRLRFELPVGEYTVELTVYEGLAYGNVEYQFTVEPE